MPALSKKQQKFMGIVRSIQKGEQPASKFSKDAQDVAKNMKKKDVKKFASTKHKGLPMKKEILGKLKEMIRQELSEYTYGSGDVVKDVNPTCPHFGAEGKVKSVNPKSVVFVVTNKGDNFKPGMELEKSHDQMKKMNENILTKQLSKMINEPESSIVKFMKKSGLDEASLLDFVEKLTRNNSRLRRIHTTILKKAIKGDKKSEKSIEKTLYGESINEMSVPGDFDKALGRLKFNQFTPTNIKRISKKFKVDYKDAVKWIKLNHVINVANKPTMAESINEMSAKTKKIINKLGKKEKEMFLTMVDMMGFDQVMSDYKRDKKAFKQALKDMSENINEKKKMFPPDKMTPKQAKEYKKFIGYAKMGVEYQIDMSLFESINEDGHTDVASAKRKAMLMVEYSNKLLNKLNGMNKEDSLPSWLSDKITLASDYLHKATHYLLNPVESVNEKFEMPDNEKRQLKTVIKSFNSKKKEFFGLNSSIVIMAKVLKKNKFTGTARELMNALVALRKAVENVESQHMEESINEARLDPKQLLQQ